MGMDLYKYQIKSVEPVKKYEVEDIETIFIDENEIKEEVDNFYIGSNLKIDELSLLIDKYEIVKSRYFEFEEFVSLVKKITNKTVKKITNKTINCSNVGDFIVWWDIGIGDDSYFVDLKEEIIDVLNKYLKDIEDVYEYDKSYDALNEVEKLNNELDKYLDLIKENKDEFYGKKYYLKDYKEDIQYSFYYYLKNIKRTELGYMRKPFKHHNDDSIGNFNGVVVNDIKKVFGKFIYSNSHVIITSQHKKEDIEELASFVPKIDRKYFLSLFPLNEDEIISIDW